MFKLKKMYFWGPVLLLIAILIPVISISAIDMTPQQRCEFLTGTYMGNYPLEICYNIPYPNGSVPDEITCPEGTNYISLFTFDGAGPYLKACGFVDLSVNMEKQGRCKFFTVSDAYLGGTVSVTGLGAPSVLRLKNENGIYKLPVILDSIDRDDTTGKWSAEFATIDPLTSQPLVPPGTYSAGCFGSNGTAGTSLEVIITR